MTNLEYALQYAEMGLRVFPLQPGTKRPLTEHGVKDATGDPKLITKWWTEMPNAGVGLAARAQHPGDPCFLEFDQRPTLKEWAKNEQQTLPLTRVHKSGGKEAPHYIFTHTDKSLALGNCDGSIGGKEWFSFRADGRYIVAPPSIHPDNQKPYTVWRDVEPLPIPDWVVDRIRVNGTRERDFAEGMRAVDEDFDFNAFCEWIPFDIGQQDGSWFPFILCPVKGARHKQQGAKGCALYFDGVALGFKCMAAECPSNMDRKEGQSGIGFLVSFLSQENGGYDGIIWTEREDQMGAVDVEETERADSPFKDIPAKKPKTDAEHIAAAEATIAKWDVQGTATAAAPAKIKLVAEVWDMPESCMYGWLGDFAKQMNCPFSLSYPAMLAIYAGQGMVKNNNVQGKIYACLIGPKGSGKSRTIDRGLLKLHYDLDWMIKRRYPGSEYGLMLTLGGKKPKEETVIEQMTTQPFLLVQDELRSTFGKIGIENSALPFMINDLFSHDEYETSNQKGVMRCRPKLSIIGGLTAENPEEFAEVFGKATTTGLYDRFIYGVAPPTWDWDDTWEDKVMPETRRAKSVGVPQAIFDMKKAWLRSKEGRHTRLGELALRIALVTASANGDMMITEECMECALQFMEWQERVRAAYRPSDQDDKDGKCQEAIVRTLERFADQDGWVKWRKAKTDGNLYRHTAVRLGRVFNGMIDQGMVEEERDTDDEGNKTKKKTGYVRMVTPE
jgi:hypothetical protein